MFNTPAFWTGFFTLLATLTAVWQKDYLDRKKENKRTLKQKAIEAYSLSNRLIHANIANLVICSNLLKDAHYDSEYIRKNYPDTTFEDLEKLELLIVENFFDLNPDFLKLNKIIVDEASRLIGIINNPKEHANQQEEFAQQLKVYQKEVIHFSSNLRKKLIDQYINITKPPMNIYNICCSCQKVIKVFKKTEDSSTIDDDLKN